MKKIVCLLIISVAIGSIFAVEADLSMEYQYGFSFQTEKNKTLDNTKGKSYQWSLSQQAINLKNYLFWNGKSIGLFLNFAFNLPSIDKQSNPQSEWQNIYLPLSFGIGAGFRHLLSDNANLHYAFGLGLNLYGNFGKSSNTSMGKTSTVKHSTHQIIFTIITDLGYKHTLVRNIFFDCGLNCSFEFAKYEKNKFDSESSYLSRPNKQQKWAEKFFGVRISPYIGLGITF